MNILSSEQINHTRLLAMRVADCIMTYYRDGFSITQKSDDSPVTQADLAASQLLEDGLPKIAPFPVLSEENTPSLPQWQAWETYWLVDPIDGTKHFINRTGDFCVCIALVHRHEAVFGLIVAPDSGELWLAQRAVDKIGTVDVVQKFLNGQLTEWSPISDLPVTTVALSSPTLTNNMQRLLDVFPESYHWYQRGSALKYMDIIEGKAMLYPKMWDTCEWDSAAGQCILTCCGGEVLRLDNGESLRYGETTSLLNPHFLAYRGLEKAVVTALLARYQALSSDNR